MAEQPLHLRPDAALEDALRGLTEAIAWPTPGPSPAGGPDLAAVVRARIEAGEATGVGAPGRSRWSWRPARRALVVAVIILLALAALAGAAGLGLPGLRIIFGDPAASPTAGGSVSPPEGSPTSSQGTASGPAPTPRPTPSRTSAPGPPGSGLPLGTAIGLDELDAQAGFHVILPSDPAIGPPDSAWIDRSTNDQVTLVWAADGSLPQTSEPGVGLLLTQFRGTVDDGYFSKILGQDTTVELVLVDGGRAYWISGQPHQFFYEGPRGFVEDSRRWVGDVLLWADGPITYRLETSLGREAAIDIAESMR